MANGKSQESVSEAANAYFSCALWARAMRSPDDEGAGTLLFNMEVLAAQYYWQTAHETAVSAGAHKNVPLIISPYPPDFRKGTGGMVGVVGGVDVVASTWFGNRPQYAFGINVLPLSAATPSLLSPDFASRAWANGVAKVAEADDTEESWRGVLLCVGAIADPKGALRRALALGDGLDSSASLSWLLRFVLGRMDGVEGDVDFRPEQYLADGEDPTKKEFEEGPDSTCAAHGGCALLGLTGNCCPTDSNVNLGCC